MAQTGHVKWYSSSMEIQYWLIRYTVFVCMSWSQGLSRYRVLNKLFNLAYLGTQFYCNFSAKAEGSPQQIFSWFQQTTEQGWNSLPKKESGCSFTLELLRGKRTDYFIYQIPGQQTYFSPCRLLLNFVLQKRGNLIPDIFWLLTYILINVSWKISQNILRIPLLDI